MNSLSALNTYGDTTLSFTDLRATTITFDRASPSNQTRTFATGGPSPAGIGINILNIINPTVVNAYYQIDVHLITGATVTWATLPAGYSVTVPSTGVYRVTGIKNAADWEIIKNATINAPAGYLLDFSYTSSIVFTGTYGIVTSPKSWTTSVKYTQRAGLTAAFSQYFNVGILIGITSNATIPATFSLSSLSGKLLSGQSTIASSLTLLSTPTRLQRTSISLELSSLMTSNNTKIPGYVTGLVTTSYIANQGNAIFAINTPRITDDNPGSSTFTITFTSSAGNFGTSTSDSSSYSFSGTMSQVNAQFANIYFWPTKNYTSNSTFIYTQSKDGSEQITKTISLNYSSTAASTQTLYEFTTAGGNNWTPTYEQYKYYNSFNILLVGGGGGAAQSTGDMGAGGGGGEVVYLTNQSLISTGYFIQVGTGGAAGYGTVTTVQAGGNGTQSTIQGTGYTKSALGGLGSTNGTTGGTSGSGYAGGTGGRGYFRLPAATSGNSEVGGGGGGGAGGAGGNGQQQRPANTGYNPYGGTGGAGITSNITGTTKTYGEGGVGSWVKSIEAPYTLGTGVRTGYSYPPANSGNGGMGGIGPFTVFGPDESLQSSKPGADGIVVIKLNF